MLRMGDRAVMNDRDLIAAPGFDMAVDGVVAGVDPRIGEPLVKRGVAVIERTGRSGVPVDRLCGIQPERLGVGFPCLI